MLKCALNVRDLALTYIPVASSTYSTLAFLGFLESGHYEISKLIGLSQGLPFEIKVTQAFRNFEIRKGEVIDLGHIVQKSLLDGKFDLFQAERDNFVFDSLIVSSNLNAVKDLNIVNNNSKKHYVNGDYSESSRSSHNNLIDWLIDLAVDDIGISEEQWSKANNDAEKLELSRSLVSPINGFIEKENVTFAGGDFGQIFIFEKEKWKKINTGILGSILSVYKINELIISGSEYGTLLTSYDDGVTWKESISFLPNDEFFHRIYCLNEKSCFAVVSVSYGQKAKVYKFNPSNVEEFKLIYEEKPTVPMFGFTSYFYKDEIIFGFPSRKIIKLNLFSSEVTTILVNNDFDILYFNEVNGVMTAVQKTGFAIGRKHYSSVDFGINWSPFDMSYMTSDVFALSDKEAVATVVTNGITYGLEIRKTTNAGQDWKLMSKIKPRCLSLRRLMYSNEFLCSTNTGVILKSNDGKNWIKQYVEEI